MFVKLIQSDKCFGPYPIPDNGYHPEIGVYQDHINKVRDSALKDGANKGYSELFVCDAEGNIPNEDLSEIIVI